VSFSNEDTIDEQVKEVLKGKLEKAISTQISLEYTNVLKERIKKRTRLGIGVDPKTGNSERLKPIQDRYKKVRKKSPRLSSQTTASRSNLTATGQMINSLTSVKIKLQDGIKFVFTVGDKRGIGLDGKPSKIGNKKLVDYQEKQGRKWLGFTKPQINQISREIRQIIIKFLQ